MIYNETETDKKELTDAMKRHTFFYNFHVNGDAALIGLAASMEEST